jgi:hypothetical protein
VFSAPRPAARACNLAICMDTLEARWGCTWDEGRDALHGGAAAAAPIGNAGQPRRHATNAPAEAGAAQVVAVGKRRGRTRELQLLHSSARRGRGACWIDLRHYPMMRARHRHKCRQNHDDDVSLRTTTVRRHRCNYVREQSPRIHGLAMEANSHHTTSGLMS